MIVSVTPIAICAKFAPTSGTATPRVAASSAARSARSKRPGIPVIPRKEKGRRRAGTALDARRLSSFGGGAHRAVAEHRGGLPGDHRALEKARVLRAPQPDRVGEGEGAEIVFGDMAVLDQLVGLGQRVAEVDHVEMADIRAEDRIELGAERVAATERGGVHAVVGLAAEIERLGVQLDPVLLAGDLAGGEIVELVAVAGQMRLARRPAVV